MTVTKLKEWPLGFDAGLNVGSVRLDDYWVPLPTRSIWKESAEGNAVLIDNNGQKQFIVTLEKSSSGISKWIEQNAAGKVAAGQLRSFATKLLGPTLGGAIGGIAGVLVPTNRPYKEWTSKTTVDGKDALVMVLLMDF